MDNALKYMCFFPSCTHLIHILPDYLDRQELIQLLFRDVNSCSGHGICVRPNVCVCGDRFIGDDCSSCVPLHWGKDCQPCPRCVNGQCNDKTGRFSFFLDLTHLFV